MTVVSGGEGVRDVRQGSFCNSVAGHVWPETRGCAAGRKTAPQAGWPAPLRAGLPSRRFNDRQAEGGSFNHQAEIRTTNTRASVVQVRGDHRLLAPTPWLACRENERETPIFLSYPPPPPPPPPLVGCSGFDRDEEKHNAPRDVWCSQLTSTSSHVCLSKLRPTISVAVAACWGGGARRPLHWASTWAHQLWVIPMGGTFWRARAGCLPLAAPPVLRTWDLPSSPVSSAPVDGKKSVVYMMVVKERVKLTPPHPPSCLLLYCSQLNKARLHNMHSGEKTKYKTNQ